MSIELLVILVPVIFGLMGFAVDLGRLYLIRGELQTAANAMAMAAAGNLIGTEACIDTANAAARAVLNSDDGAGNRYNFAGQPIGQTNGFLSSEAPDPVYFETTADATGAAGGDASTSAGGSVARYARVTVTADAPLVFWSFLPLGVERKTPVQVAAVAGISPPLCTACNIEPIAVAPIDAADTDNFGFTVNTRYTFAYACTGQPAPQQLNGPMVTYVLVDRYDTQAQAFADESTQLYRMGVQGLPSSNGTMADTGLPLACIQHTAVNPNGEAVWANAAPLACSSTAPPMVTSFLCGVANRFDPAVPDACINIPEVEAFGAYPADTDLTDLDDYTVYTGNARRILTIPIVDTVGGGTMQVQAFRQFLVEPNPNGGVNINPADTDGRFVALYIGSVVPLKQGRFDGGCQLTAGPGKVVLHQ